MTIDGKVYKLLEAMCGLRDAGAAFDRKVLHVMTLMGVSLGKFSFCGHRKVMDTLVRLVRWCDDSSLSGRRLCKAFRDELGRHLLVKTAVMGPKAEMGDVQEANPFAQTVETC